MVDADLEKRVAGEAAAQFIEDGMDVGLGTGSTVAYLLDAVGKRVVDGLSIRTVVTSEWTAARSRELGIPVIPPDEISRLDIAIDGADEVDQNFAMIKGGGGALLREKIVLNAADQHVIIVDSSKWVDCLGDFGLPIEIIPFGENLAMAAITELGAKVTLRERDGSVFVSDNGNHIVDCDFGDITDPAGLDRALLAIPGVVETGLFVGLLDQLVVGRGDTAEIVNAG